MIVAGSERDSRFATDSEPARLRDRRASASGTPPSPRTTTSPSSSASTDPSARAIRRSSGKTVTVSGSSPRLRERRMWPGSHQIRVRSPPQAISKAQLPESPGSAPRW